jgi:hypothetical protein
VPQQRPEKGLECAELGEYTRFAQPKEGMDENPVKKQQANLFWWYFNPLPADCP